MKIMRQNKIFYRATLSSFQQCAYNLMTLVLFIATSTGLAQSESQIQYFRGGHTEFNTQMSMAGPGPLVMQSGSELHRVHLNPARNPAFLITDPGRGFSIYAGLPISLNLSSIAGINSKVQTGVDDALAPYQDVTASNIYPLVDARIKTTLPVQKVAVTIKKDQYHIGASWDNLIAIGTRARLVGMEMRASTPTESGSGTTDVILNARFNGHLDYDFRVQRVNAMIAIPLSDNFNLGVQVSRLFVHFKTNGQAFIDATMLYSGSEYAFNDPNALWPNSLDQRINGKFNGQSMQYRIGFSCASGNSIWEFMMDTGAFIQCPGEMDLLQNTIPAFQLDALLEGEEDSEILEASELNLSQLTRTEPIQNTTYDKIRVGLPASFHAGYMHDGPSFLWHVGLSGFYGGYILRYGSSGMELKPKWKTSGYIQFKSWFMHADVMFMNSRVQEIPAITSGNLAVPVPRLSIGKMIMKERWRIYPSLQISPVPSLQTVVQMEI